MSGAFLSVDKDKSEERFISRMTATCTYAAGEEVLPKNSLLYSCFTVLNEINNIRINGVRIDPAIKQGLYNRVFMKHRKVRIKDIRDFLFSEGVYSEGNDKLDGIDISLKSSLKPHIDFQPFFESGKLNMAQAEEIIARITATTDRKRLKNWLREHYAALDAADIAKISGFGYTDYGRLSKKLLNGISDIDVSTGEIVGGTIIEQLWNGSENLMELLSDRHSYSVQLEQDNREYYTQNPKNISDRLSEMYVPTAARRAVIRTIDIAAELKKLTGCSPKKIFVEMARDHTDDLKGKRTVSRKDKVRSFLNGLPETEELLKQLENKSEGELRGDKLFLYFMQLGRCMYSGEPIDIDTLATKSYDIDHIFPQSKIKDDSIDNRVLVKSELNGAKGDKYPVDGSIREKMRGFWDKLHKSGLISDKKFERLTRSTQFSDEELADFINRQLVETRQSTKAVAALLKELYPETEIVYVKAGIVSEFRQEYDLLKCRDINDLHHAKDAYLNIVMGQVYDTKFTRSPMNFIKERGGENRGYSMKLKSLLDHDISRGGVVAWKKDETLCAVKKQMARNNIRFVRYSFCKKESLFSQMPLRKGHGQVARKKNLDVEKYGGYQNPAVAYFILVKYIKGKKSVISLEPVELRFSAKLRTVEDYSAYCNEILGLPDAEVLLGGRKIKINALLEIDGFRVNVSSRSNDSVWFKGGMQLVLPQEHELYAKKIYSYCEKYSEAVKLKAEIPAVTKYDKLTAEQNIALYDLLLDKLENTAYHVLMDTPLKLLKDSRQLFTELPVEKQTVALSHIIELFRCNTSSGKDLTLLDGSKASGILKMSMALNAKRFSDIRIIDQSPTGLIERRSENLFEL